MALTYLDTAMIEQPANIPYLSAGEFVATDATLESADINTLSAYNFYANNILNNTDLFGNLTVYGAVSALSGITYVETFNTSTTALSVINTGVGPALYVSQDQNTAGVATFIGYGQEILKVNNVEPDTGQATVTITKGQSNKSLSATGTSTFEDIDSDTATIDTFTSTNINATSATIGTLTPTTVNAGSINVASISAGALQMPSDSYAFFGNMTVYGQINALSGIQNISSLISETSALSVVSVAQAPALFVKQSNAAGSVASFYGNDVEVLRVNNTVVNPGLPGIVVTGSISGSNLVQATGGNSNNWNSVYTNVQNTSSTWTGGNNAFTNVQTNSANWNTAYNSVNTNATNWTNTYNTVNTNNANWTSTYTTVKNTSANWQTAYTSINTNETNWNNTYTTVRDTSATWTPSKILTATNFNAESGLKYLVDTTSGIVYGTLPTPPVTGSVISFEDPFSTWDTNNFIVLGNGSNIESTTDALSCDIEGSAFSLTYVGGSRGWKVS